MSQSGIPVVSQVAQAASNVVDATGSVFSGGNVFENLGRITVAPFTAAADLTNDVTFGLAGKVPLVGDVFSGGSALHEDQTSKDAAFKFGKGVAVTGATVAGGVFAGPLIAPSLGVTSTVGSGLGALTANKIINGGNVFDSLMPLASQGFSSLIPDLGFDLPDFGNTFSDSGRAASASQAPRIYTNNVQQPLSGSGSSSSIGIFVVVGLAIVLFLMMRKK